MNAEFTLTFWRESFGLLALQIAGVVAIAAIAQCLAKSASWRRSIWQIAIATAGLLAVAEWSGAGRNAMNWAETNLAARRTMAAVHPTILETTPTFESESAPISPISPSFRSDHAESVSDPLSPPPVAAPFEKAKEPTVSPAVWWPAWLWFAGFAVLSLRFLLLNSVFFLFRFFRRLPVDAALSARVQVLAPQLGLKRGVRVVALRGLTGPVAFGVVRPTIGVPPDYSRDFTPAEQDAMLAHELAHLSAHDPAWSWLADIVSAVLWWHPLIWIARRQLRSASETAADEASALLQDGPETLAECLVNLGAKLASGSVYGGMGVAERGFRSALGKRVERLLKLRPGSWQPPRRWTSLATKSFALTSLLIITIGCGAWMSPRHTTAVTVVSAMWQAAELSAVSSLFAAVVTFPPLTSTNASTPYRSGGRLSGWVRLVGTPPPEIKIELPESVAERRGGEPMLTRHYVVGKDGGLANVVVYVKSGLKQQTFAKPFDPLVLTAQGAEWSPYISAAQASQTIVVRILDPEFHEFSTVSRFDNYRFAPKFTQPEFPIRFGRPEMFIPIKGDIHNEMVAYVSVFDHPYFAVTDQDGRFRVLGHLPPGTYEIEARHFTAGSTKNTVTVRQGEDSQVDFTLNIPVGAAEVGSNVSIANQSTAAGLGIPQDKLSEYRETLVRIELLRNKEFELRSQYTEQNSLVKTVRQQIKASEEQKQKLELETPKLIHYSAATQNGAPAAAALPGSRSKTGSKEEADAPRSSNANSTKALGFNWVPGDQNFSLRTNALPHADADELHTRTYKVDPNTFLRSLERYNRGELGSPTGYQELVRLFFKNAGVDLAAPKSVFFHDRNGLLLARATLKDLEIIQQAIEVLNSAPAQVTIQARFAELKESDSKALGFNWFAGIQYLALQTNNLAPSKTNELAGAITGILTENQFRTVMKALEQRGGVDILSAPRVTTLSGRQAQISALDSKSIVTGVNSKTNSDGTVTSSPVVTPTQFGPTLDIIPNVSADGYSIQITVTATVTEFMGYEKPAPALQDSWGKVSKEAIPLPITRTRQVTTSAVVWDGQTLVLSGLISENEVKVKDKVPVLGDLPLLGRLFRSESKIAQKKNLLIFVTPTLIDPAWNRVHPGESLRSQTTIPPQP